MSDNIVIKDGAGVPKTMATQDVGGVHTPKHIVTDSALPAGAATSAKQDILATLVGSLGETAYAGSGNKGINGLLKGIYTALFSEVKTQPYFPASGVAPITGTFSGTGNSASFAPIPGRPFNLTLSGTWTATIRVERSFDNGVTWVPLTAAGYPFMLFIGICSETHVECEAGVTYRFACTAHTSGTVAYRISQ